MKADLHIHTTESDGRLSREAIFKRAKDKGIDIISITDHDTCLHVEDNRRLMDETGVSYVPGIELSTLYVGKNVHVLGYFKGEGFCHPEMLEYYVTIQEGRRQRALTFIRNLKTLYNIDITYQDVLDVSNGIIARPHIAKAIRKHYPEYSYHEVFKRFIGDHTDAFVPSTELPLQEGIDLLKRHGALTILAHPKLLSSQIRDRVIDHDTDGIEALYGLNTATENDFYKAIARKKNWLMTAGSDYHGIENDPKHKEIGDVYLTGEPLKRFLDALND